MIGAGRERSSDLIVTVLVRARFCERLSPRLPHGNSDLFLMGMLSVMDALPKMPIAKVLEQVPVD